jgi:hypothetical protein
LLNSTPEGGWIVQSRAAFKSADVTGLELIVKPLASIAGSGAEESASGVRGAKRRPLVSETVIGPWHNGKTVRDRPQFAGLGTPAPDKTRQFVWAVGARSISIQCRPLARYWYLKSISFPGPAFRRQRRGPRLIGRAWARN